ncbi:epoxide hydrolase family protein [Sinorhizobium meliloti]|uniref:epoxide hydrolase family protein n=1 Tax=Rhizobium meliloti TaxID=382 RepID=UPI0002FBC7BE|nr:epoxide hydrolase family protein [Sinorhizobium meliloti]MDE4605039.1 epoxide hydrolase [Sinorhizobium meliloti]UDU21689.1 epoxide hydrolase [Sinorhizobium meliloti]
MNKARKVVVVDGASQNIGSGLVDASFDRGNRVVAAPRSRQSLRRMLAAASVGAIGLFAATAASAEGAATKAPASTVAAVAAQPAHDASIRPFSFQASDEALADLKQRVKATRWPSQELVPDDTQGVRLATMQKLADYWANQYDWRRAEADINKHPQFVTNIDGVDIHFIHVKSKHKNALPVIITHGWPGSVIEQLKIINRLTDPTAHGGTEADAFDVVIPSLPGYGFSGKPTALGWDPQHVARAWAVLMDRLGYKKYVAQGGDWGDAVNEQMALQKPAGLLGIHTNMPGTLPDNISAALAGGPQPTGLKGDEEYAWKQLDFFYKNRVGYALEMGARPQTLYGLDDSPIALAAWMIDHDPESQKLVNRVFDGTTEGLTRDDILDNITLYWLTKTGLSSGRLFWESKLAFFAPKGVTIPVAVSAFPDEIYTAPRSWTEKAFPNLIFYKRHQKGGHFAAWEQPQALVEDMREGFRSLR